MDQFCWWLLFKNASNIKTSRAGPLSGCERVSCWCCVVYKSMPPNTLRHAVHPGTVLWLMAIQIQVIYNAHRVQKRNEKSDSMLLVPFVGLLRWSCFLGCVSGPAIESFMWSTIWLQSDDNAQSSYQANEADIEAGLWPHERGRLSSTGISLRREVNYSFSVFVGLEYRSCFTKLSLESGHCVNLSVRV